MAELLETVDSDGRPAGLVARSDVHRLGLWHRAANVFVFDGRGRLLIQKRSAAKDVCPGAWDLSVAEHLLPGEDYETCAIRGLREELGVELDRLEPLTDVVESKLDMPDIGIRDYELQRTYLCRWDGPLSPDPDEVAEVKRVELASLAAELADAPEQFTPWFRQRAEDVALFSRAR